MNDLCFTPEVLSIYPDAVISVDDGESLIIRINGFVCGCRLMATGKWSVGVRDRRDSSVSYDLADNLGEDGIERRELVIPTLKRLLEAMMQIDGMAAKK